MVFTVLHLSIFSGILIESNHGVTKSVENGEFLKRRAKQSYVRIPCIVGRICPKQCHRKKLRKKRMLGITFCLRLWYCNVCCDCQVGFINLIQLIEAEILEKIKNNIPKGNQNWLGLDKEKMIVIVSRKPRGQSAEQALFFRLPDARIFSRTHFTLGRMDREPRLGEQRDNNCYADYVIEINGFWFDLPRSSSRGSILCCDHQKQFFVIHNVFRSNLNVLFFN